ncbi:MAG: insulinase family protein [Oscillospiraceae bacterium]|nr:insulinase family protein [Oscillospiraceae bacterium]
MKLNPSFTLLRSRSLPEISGTLHEMEHIATGARLCWLQRPDENKTFAIAFTTLPEDSTGVFHILEHSVLCGSEKYPLKEPFVELLKNSMNTFLNAMTFPDKTCYPVSSKNDKDFLNLMRVYLDAVFCPLIHTKPEIFCQEGWHYEFDENGNPSYKGVVFNEMKGAMASPDEIVGMTMMEQLFPDTCYRFNSGGEPSVIPDLTYEQFAEAHRKCYAPSNSYIFLDGDVDIDAVLAILGEEYLSKFQRSQRLAPPAHQAPLNAGTRTVRYELGQEESPDNRWRLSLGNVIGDFADQETATAMQVLARVLCAGNQSPLTRAILEKGLAENVSMQVQEGTLQNWVLLDVENCRQENLERIEETIRGELSRLADQGLDHEQLTAQMANMEFRMRERDYHGMPHGLVYGLNLMETWLYGGDPAANLEVGTLFDDLRSKMAQGYFEELIRSLLLNNPHTARLILEPSHTLGQERRQAEQQRLDREAALWSDGDKQSLLALQNRVQAWQASTDSPEALATLPRLDLSDISTEPETLPMEETSIAGIPVLKHDVACGGIVYTTLYFDCDDLTLEELSQSSLMGILLGDLATQTHTPQQLMILRQLLCGRMSMRFFTTARENEPTLCHRKLCVEYSALEQNLTRATELVMELLTATRYDDEAAVLEILRQVKTGMTQQIIMSGSALASGRVAAQSTVTGVVDEHTGGFEFYRWLKIQEEQESHASLLTALAQANAKVFCRSRLTVSVTGTCPDGAEQVTALLAQALPEGSIGPEFPLRPWGKRKEGIVIPADVSFAVKGGNVLDYGGRYSGLTPLASRIIGLGYLWNAIRVQGGAYGSGLTTRTNGTAACHSFRDPNAARSLEQYDNAADFLRSLCQSGADLTGFIIGAVSGESGLLTPRMKGAVADMRHWCGVDEETLRRRRAELLNATPAELIHAADYLEKTIREGGICVIGNQKALEACGLDTLLNL